MNKQTQTWHHGLVARWWAEFNNDGPEIALFQKYIEEHGGPVLDVGCGTGRLLIPYLKAGIDIEGADTSEDMLNWCRSKLLDEDLKTNLYPQAIHELDVPKTYQTIINCGAFGLGGGRAEDLEGLKRIYNHLQPGGVFVMDWYLPNFDEKGWIAWLPEHRPDLPRSWSRKADRKTAADGTVLEMRARQIEFDPLEQTYEAEISINHSEDDRLLGTESSVLRGSIYFKNEIVLMLEAAGFESVSVRSGTEDRAPLPWMDGYLLFIARKCG
jgi:SAM-dependent methyltransferase